jgi:hypothetical protein
MLLLLTVYDVIILAVFHFDDGLQSTFKVCFFDLTFASRLEDELEENFENVIAFYNETFVSFEH